MHIVQALGPIDHLTGTLNYFEDKSDDAYSGAITTLRNVLKSVSETLGGVYQLGQPLALQYRDCLNFSIGFLQDQGINVQFLQNEADNADTRAGNPLYLKWRHTQTWNGPHVRPGGTTDLTARVHSGAMPGQRYWPGEGVIPKYPNGCQDRCFAAELQGATRAIGIFDGSGGENAEKVATTASASVLKYLYKSYMVNPPADGSHWRSILERAFHKAERKILNAPETIWEDSAGCTGVVAVVEPQIRRATVAHVGDSRALHFVPDEGSGTMRAVWQSVDHESTERGFGNRLRKALPENQRPTVLPDITKLDIEPNSVIAVVSDGILNAYETPDHAVWAMGRRLWGWLQNSQGDIAADILEDARTKALDIHAANMAKFSRDDCSVALIHVSQNVDAAAVAQAAAPAPVPVGGSETISVATVNAWDGASKQGLFRSYMDSVGSNQRPDLIFLQEAPTTIEHVFGNADGYEEVSLRHPVVDTGYERMMTLRRRDSGWNHQSTYVVRTNSCDTQRVATVQVFKHTSGKTVTIANVHLCGGRFDEGFHCLSTMDQMKDAKVEVMSDILSRSPDIVLGDFNSDYLAYQTKSPDRLAFLQGVGCSAEKAQQWHDAPYELLVSKGFSRVPLNDPTSRFGTLPDGIWFSNGRVQMEASSVLDALSTGASDHNGLMSTLRIA